MQNTITLGVTSNYCKNWTIEDAIREIIANALDASKKLDISWNNGIATVRDYGKGFHATGLLIGESTKTASDIGQFGEGLKVGAMVLLRNGQHIQAESLGKTYTFTMEDSIVGTPVLTIAMAVSTPFGSGTKVTFSCSESELESTKQRFLKLSPRPMFGKDILDHAGAIYVQGLLTDSIDSILGYNLHSKECMNRDRTTTNRDAVEREISKLLRQCKSHDAILKVVKWCGSDDSRKLMESQLYIDPKHPRLWKKSFHEAYGSTACLAEGNAERARYMGFNPVRLPSGITYTLGNCGVATANSATKKDASKSSKVTVTTPQRANLIKAKRILQPIFEPDLTERYSIRVCTMEANGEREGNVLRINVNQLDSLQTTISTLLHEFCHLVSDAPDCSSRFEQALTKYSGLLAMTLLERGNSKTTPSRVKKGVSPAPCPSIPIEDAEAAEETENPEKGEVVTPDPTPIRQLIKETEREIARLEREIASQTVNASRETEPTVMKGSFGLPMENVTTYWGARAIYQPSSKTNFMPIEILHDRQSCLGEKPDRDELVAWLNTTGMPWLKANCRMPSNSSERIEFKDGKFIIRATPNASYGYLYIGAGIVSN